MLDQHQQTQFLNTKEDIRAIIQKKGIKAKQNILISLYTKNAIQYSSAFRATTADLIFQYGFQWRLVTPHKLLKPLEAVGRTRGKFNWFITCSYVPLSSLSSLKALISVEWERNQHTGRPRNVKLAIQWMRLEWNLVSLIYTITNWKILRKNKRIRNLTFEEKKSILSVLRETITSGQSGMGMSQISFCRTFRRFAAADTDDEGQATRKQILIGGMCRCRYGYVKRKRKRKRRRLIVDCWQLASFSIAFHRINENINS